MRRASGVLAFAAGAALAATNAGAAIGQEEDPSPDAAMAPGASTEAMEVEPSTLEIKDVAGAKAAGKQLKGKKLKKAVAKAAPAAARYVINSTGEDAIERIIGLSLAARDADEAGDQKAAAALIDIATLLYRNEWTSTGSNPLSLNAAIDEAVAAAGLTGDPALVQVEIFENYIDTCLHPDWTIAGPPPENPSWCEEEGGTLVRFDMSGVPEDRRDQPETWGATDDGGVGIHMVVQDGLANDKLPTKKFRKALAKALQKHGVTIAGYESSERGIIEMVLAARAADEAGNQQAAKAYMQLALAAYRSGVQKPDETGNYDPAYHQSIDQLIREEYEGLPGLELYPPEGLTDACFDRKGKFVTCVDTNSPFECYGAGGSRLERLPLEEINDCEG